MLPSFFEDPDILSFKENKKFRTLGDRIRSLRMLNVEGSRWLESTFKNVNGAIPPFVLGASVRGTRPPAQSLGMTSRVAIVARAAASGAVRAEWRGTGHDGKDYKEKLSCGGDYSVEEKKPHKDQGGHAFVFGGARGVIDLIYRMVFFLLIYNDVHRPLSAKPVTPDGWEFVVH